MLLLALRSDQRKRLVGELELLLDGAVRDVVALADGTDVDVPELRALLARLRGK